MPREISRFTKVLCGLLSRSSTVSLSTATACDSAVTSVSPPLLAAVVKV
jgi:hypothetical protein